MYVVKIQRIKVTRYMYLYLSCRHGELLKLPAFKGTLGTLCL